MDAALADSDRQFLKALFRAVVDKPLPPDDPRYVPLYGQEGVLDEDPVDLLFHAIDFLDESAQLLAGFRGIGKSTELLRLRKKLMETGYKVILIDVEDYINLSTPVDISDFLMAMAGAFGDAVADDALLGKDVLKETYWERLLSFLQAKIEVQELSAELGAKAGVEVDAAVAKKNAEMSAKLGLKANLKEDPRFKERLQTRMAGHLGALVAHVRKFFEDCLKAFQNKYGEDVKVVLIVDSIEHIRGTSVNAKEVQASVETLFATHADKLKLPQYHVIYTIPPFLKVRFPNLGSLYGTGAVQMFPSVKVRDRADKVATPGYELMREIIRRRHEGIERLLTRADMDLLIAQSGGHLRDLLRLLAEVIRRARALPVSTAVVKSAIDQMRTECLPLAEDDAVWLSRIAKTNEAALVDRDEGLVHLARFFDTNMVLCYRNGPEWYDVHPLIRDHALKLAEAVEARAAASAAK